MRYVPNRDRDRSQTNNTKIKRIKHHAHYRSSTYVWLGRCIYAGRDVCLAFVDQLVVYLCLLFVTRCVLYVPQPRARSTVYRYIRVHADACFCLATLKVDKNGKPIAPGVVIRVYTDDIGILLRSHNLCLHTHSLTHSLTRPGNTPTRPCSHLHNTNKHRPLLRNRVGMRTAKGHDWGEAPTPG